jgi:hypothetical protein
MDIRIGRFEARYRLPHALESEADRLDRTLAAMLGEPLERALELAGVREDEELCIRHLHVPVRIHAGATDAAVETEWVLALARAFERARHNAEQHAGSETFLAAPERDELTAVDAKRRRAERELEEESVAVVRYRSRHAALLDMAVRVARGDLSREWAWKQIGLWPHVASSTREAAGYLVEALLSEPRSIAAVLVTLARFELLRELWLLLAPQDWVRLASAALEAAGLDAAAALAAVVDALRRQPGEVLEFVFRSQPWLVLAASRTRSDRAEVEVAVSAIVCTLALGADPSLRVLTLGVAERLTTVKPDEAHLANIAEKRDIGLPIPGATRYGGLLFLLNLLNRTGLIDEIRDDLALGGRAIRWTVHQLALKLVPVEHDDPAAMAFAGLLPGEKPPSDAESGPDEDESEALDGWAQRITATVGKLLAESDFSSNEIALNFVCRRDANVDGDPGWIVITFPIETVAVEIRRVGLDSDPGWLPLLGTVVRFVYE